jgi:hypothetical protein
MFCVAVLMMRLHAHGLLGVELTLRVRPDRRQHSGSAIDTCERHWIGQRCSGDCAWSGETVCDAVLWLQRMLFVRTLFKI